MTNRVNVLVVDDDPAVGSVLEGLIEQAGAEASISPNAKAALAALELGDFDCVITDLNMPGMNGMELVSHLNRAWPELPVIVLTAHGSIPTAVEAMQRGASDFLTKPFEREDLLRILGKVDALRRPPSSPPQADPGNDGILGEAPCMAQLRGLIRKAAATSATVLITGETGTGKELVARGIHAASARSKGPMVTVHCAALPDALLESELFGYEKGAFTGATSAKPGRVALSERGTLFLDEIGDVSPSVQVKLLRLLQEREYDVLGGVRPRKADVRFVAATHRRLEDEVAKGTFRQDLFYRLNVLPIRIPPLRERAEDVERLVEHYRKRACQELGLDVTLSQGAQSALRRHNWPGNVRELQNLVERLVVLNDGPIVEESQVLAELGQSPTPNGTGNAHAVVSKGPADKEQLLQVLRRSGNNRALAARLLGVSRRTLYNRLAAFGITENPEL